MCTNFGCGSTVVSKRGGGTDRHTDRQREAAALYNRLACYPASLGRKGGGREGREGGRGGKGREGR